MRVRFTGLIGACVAVTIAMAMPARAADDGFTPLFNGTDLTGWEGDARLWRVEDGVIVGTTDEVKIEKNTFFATKANYSDFILRAKVKLRNHNSGIQFRSESIGDYAVAGYQADIAEKTYFGMLYEEQKRGFLPYWGELSDAQRAAIPALAHLDGWNDFEIHAEGDHIKLVLNGITTCDMIDPEGAKSGLIALQLHAGDPMEVRFKDIEIKTFPSRFEDAVMPDYDATRTDRLEFGEKERFRVPEGFSVEEVASDELIGSVVNMTFDYKGRPTLSAEGAGIRLLHDEDGDGIFEKQTSFCEEIQTAHGMHFIAPGDLLVQSEGPYGTGMYRLTDTDLDDVADVVSLVAPANGGIQEHGPHTILTGFDGQLRVLFGNHAHPGAPIEPESPLGVLQEDYLLPRYVDPRGHANNIMAPGGSINRLDPETGRWYTLTAGFRNPFDMGANINGEIFAFDSDMEWDFRLPWYRPIRVAHAIPGADFGWRTGSSKKPFYYIDTLPSVDDIGRGSPVGVAFYYHHVYPEKYYGAFFMGDWSRGRIRIMFPERIGATYRGATVDFVLGEPLNVTDLDVAPDGMLYFTVGGRYTHGGLFRVRYDKPGAPAGDAASGVRAILDQPMPRSAWGQAALLKAREEMGKSWGVGLEKAAANKRYSVARRLRAIEALQVYGPKPPQRRLQYLVDDEEPEIRAAGVYLMGELPIEEVEAPLTAALADPDPFVARRACEALVQAGLGAGAIAIPKAELVDNLFALLDHPDRFLRYSARKTIEHVQRGLWVDRVLNGNVAARPRGIMTGLLAAINVQQGSDHSDQIFAKLTETIAQPLTDAQLVEFIRVAELAFIRDKAKEPNRQAFKDALGAAVLARFPAIDHDLNREAQVILAYLQSPGAIEPMLTQLSEKNTQEDQIHTMYCLRTIKEGWTPEQREAAVVWFDRGREFGGAASMAGYIDNMWTSLMEILPPEEQQLAAMRKAEALKKRQEDALALLAQIEGESPKASGELAQMSYEELAEYLEYDPMAYREPNLARGEKVFIKAKCANCHIFGTKGQGGGPDLSTVTSRFRRSDILESIMFPSKVVSDQYVGVIIETKDLNEYTGMIASENDDELVLIDITGERVTLKKDNIDTRKEAEGSIMPQGLLNALTMGDLVDLVQFLEHGAE